MKQKQTERMKDGRTEQKDKNLNILHKFKSAWLMKTEEDEDLQSTTTACQSSLSHRGIFAASRYLALRSPDDAAGKPCQQDYGEKKNLVEC